MRYFATAIPGLHPVLAREIEALRGARSAYAGVHPLRARMTFRVVARVRSEQRFLRTELQGDPERWFAATLGELARVTRPDGSIVLLVPRSPAFERALARQPAIRSTDRLDLRLLGMTTALWTFRRL